MKIILIAEISGTRDGKVWPPVGSEVDLPEQEAKDMIQAGQAVDPDSDEGKDWKERNGLTLEELAGAPDARDETAGQPETNLSRAKRRELGNVGTDEARKAAEELYQDPVERPGQGENQPTVGDGQPSPLHTGADGTAEDTERATASPTTTRRTQTHSTTDTGTAQASNTDPARNKK